MMQTEGIEAQQLLFEALKPVDQREARKIKARRLMTGDRILLKPGDQVTSCNALFKYTVTENMFPVVHSIKTTALSSKLFVNLMNGKGEVLGHVTLSKEAKVTLNGDRASIASYSQLPSCVTSIDFYDLPGLSRRWAVFNEYHKIGEIWSHESGLWHCWAIRDSNQVVLKNIDACLTFIAGVYKARLDQDDNSRAALLSILKD